jgi:membrane protease YdiL (CAAX protease family)
MTSTSPSPSSSGEHERQRVAPVAAWWHTGVLILVILTFSILQGLPRNMARVTAFPSRIPIYAQTLAYELALFAYVWLLGIRRRGVTIGELIGGKWDRFEDFMIDLATALGFWAVVVAFLIVASFALHFRGVDAAKPLLPQTPAEAVCFVVLAVTAGFCEEFIFRGYLQRQMLALTGTAWAAVALQAVFFGAAHIYQGWRGVIVITIYGSLFGALAAWRKSLRPGMLQHAGQDTLSGIIGYLATKYKLI